MQKTILKTICASLLGFGMFFAGTVVYAAEPITVYFFHGDGCPHCAQEEVFLENLEKREDIEVQMFEVWQNTEHRALLSEVAAELGATLNGVPVTVVGQRAIVGWISERTTGASLLNTIEAVRKEGDIDIVAHLLNEDSDVSVPDTTPGTTTDPLPPDGNTTSTPDEGADDPYSDIAVPEIIKEWGSSLSLPLLTVLFGAIDGFNPCAMWALVFLIALLFGMENKKRMWILGGAFILTSGVVYFLFMAAWLNLILFLGFIVWIRILIGLVAIAGGVYYLYEWKTAPEAGCKATNESQKTKLTERMRRAIGEKNFLLALIGIIIVAALINLVELVCSAGLPAAYAQVLALHDLSSWQYYGYLVLYTIVFMLDDMIVFGVAMGTLSFTGISRKYTHTSQLIGGILMLIIGLLLVFRPELLLFG